jgi:hypothetical protein
MSGAVLLVLDAATADDAERLVEAALRMVRRCGGRVQILTVVDRPSPAVSMAPVAVPWTVDSLWEENAVRADDSCRRLVDRMPTDVCIRRTTARGPAERLIAAALATGEVAAVAFDGRLTKRRAFRRAACRWHREGVEVQAVW